MTVDRLKEIESRIAAIKSNPNYTQCKDSIIEINKLRIEYAELDVKLSKG